MDNYFADGGKDGLTVNCYPSKPRDVDIPLQATLSLLDIAINVARALDSTAVTEVRHSLNEFVKLVELPYEDVIRCIDELEQDGKT